MQMKTLRTCEHLLFPLIVSQMQVIHNCEKPLRPGFSPFQGVFMRRAILKAGISLTALAFAMPAFAADDGEGERFSPILDTVTVFATRSPIAAFEYPGSVSVIDRDAIDDLAASSIADLFEDIPGVQFDGGPRRTGEVPSIRGVQGEGVLILFDGVRQTFLSGHDGRFFIDPDLLQAAEVIRGPNSALYGSGALGGVIAFRTLTAGDALDDDELFGYSAKAGYFSVNEEWVAGGTAFGRTADGRFDGVASITYRDSGDIELGDGFTLPSDDEILSGLVKGTARITDDLTASVSWIRFQNDAIEPNNGQGVSTGDLVEKEVRSNTIRAGLNYAPANNNWVDAEVVGFYTEAQVEEAELESSRVILRDVETFGVTALNRSAFKLGTFGDVVFTYGGEYFQDEQVGTDSAEPDGLRGGVPNATADTLGAFIQAEFSVDTAIGEFLFIPALRYDRFQNEGENVAIDTDEDAFSPKIGLTWRPTEWSLLYANYAEAFRAPAIDELFAQGVHFVIPLGPGIEAPNAFIPNTDLRSEESSTWEIGAGLDFETVLFDGDRFIVKTTYYEADVTDLIDLQVDQTFSPSCFAPIPGPCTSGTSRYVNTRNARLEGIELEASYDTERVYANLSYSTIDGENEDTGEFVGILTPNRLNIDVGVRILEIESRLGLRGEFASEFDKANDRTDFRDAYEVIDLYYVYAPIDGPLEGLRLDLGVDNLFDEEYERVFAGVPEPGRNYKAVVRWQQGF